MALDNKVCVMADERQVKFPIEIDGKKCNSAEELEMALTFLEKCKSLERFKRAMSLLEEVEKKENSSMFGRVYHVNPQTMNVEDIIEKIRWEEMLPGNRYNDYRGWLATSMREILKYEKDIMDEVKPFKVEVDTASYRGKTAEEVVKILNAQGKTLVSRKEYLLWNAQRIANGESLKELTSQYCDRAFWLITEWINGEFALLPIEHAECSGDYRVNTGVPKKQPMYCEAHCLVKVMADDDE